VGPAEPVNPYQAPRPELIPEPAGLSASLEDAIAGRYDFDIGDVMEDAWALVKGMKASFWGAWIVIALIWGVVDVIVGTVVGQLLTGTAATVVNQAFSSVVTILMTPFTVGLQMMCVRRALGMPISFGTAFSYVNRGGPAIVAALLVTLFCYLGLAFLIIPGVYLFVAYFFATQLVVDQDLGAWRAMEISRKAVTRRWWRVFGLIIVVGLLTALSALLLLIPLIWTFPWAMMVAGVLYRQMFYARHPASA